MLLEKSNNYSGTLLFHAAGIVDLWYPPSGCPFCRASLQRYYNADKYHRRNHEHCHVTIQKCPYVTAKQRFYTFLPNKTKAAFRALQHKKRLFIVLFQEQRTLRKLIPAGPLRSRESARRSGLLCTESIRATFDCLITVYHISNFIASTILFYKYTFNFCSLSLSYLVLFK